jgi:hypothetical protein
LFSPFLAGSETGMKHVFLALTVAVAAASAACASAIAKTPPERPTLEVPAPPAKVVEPPPRIDPVTPEPVADLPTTPPANARPPRTPTRETAKPEVKPEATATEAAPAPVTPPAPAPVLRTPGSPDSAEAAKQVQDIRERASKTLNSMDPRRFAKGKNDQYKLAKLLLTQSEDALKKADFENAKKLALKADDIANELKGR